MIKGRVLKTMLVVVGLLLLAVVFTLWRWLPHQTVEQILGVIYATLGVFLLLASRNSAVSRGLIAFASWSSVVHAAIMAVLIFGWSCGGMR